MCKCKGKCGCDISAVTKGEKGDIGPQGVQGEQGPQGPAGAPGQTVCCNFTVRIDKSEITPPDGDALLQAIVTPATPGVTYEWSVVSANNSIGIFTSLNELAEVAVITPIIGISFGGYQNYMETFKVIVRSEDGCCVQEAYFNMFYTIYAEAVG